MTSSQKVIQEYFILTEKYRKEFHGKGIALLMQVGDFYEVYGYEENGICNSDYSDIENITRVCDAALANKVRLDENKRYVMAGFPLISLDKYIEILTKNNFIVPVHVQVKDPATNKVRERVCDNIYSPGTYTDDSLTNRQNVTNNIISIWIQKYNQKNIEYVKISGAVMNMYTSETKLFEYDKKWIFDSTTFDELDTYMTLYNPHEIICVTNLQQDLVNDVIKFCGLQNIHCHYFDVDNDEIKNVKKQTYQKHIIEKLHGNGTYDICFEFRKVFALQSYCVLLNFLEKCNKSYTKNIKFPVCENNGMDVILANHTLEQLNIVCNTEKYGKESSVFSLLNKTKTNMGNRIFKNQLCNPTYNEEWLTTEYNFTDYVLRLNEKDNTLMDEVRKLMNIIIDIEKFIRKVISRRVFPCEVAKLHSSLLNIKNINNKFLHDDKLFNYLFNDSWDVFNNMVEKLMVYIETIFNVTQSSSINNFKTIVSSFYNNGYSYRLDTHVNVLNENEVKLQCFIEQHFKDYSVKIEEKKDEIYLQITEKRSKDWRKQNNGKEITFKKTTGTNMRIEGSHESICKDIFNLKNTISDMVKKMFYETMDECLNENSEQLYTIADVIGKLDVIINKAYISKMFNYCKPEIKSANKSYVSAKNLRHCLIEHINKKELYVGNDIILGKNTDGMLLYGTNAVGKTSFIRALGISIIMAQSGLYVPCNSFEFKPYCSIYSRILNHDNLFRGLSTFAVEMSELRVILNDTNKNSLVLGDELCSGTEMQSALGIFSAGLIHLHEKHSSFIFATHFHEITDLQEIKELKKINFYHLTVKYNYETQY